MLKFVYQVVIQHMVQYILIPKRDGANFHVVIHSTQIIQQRHV
jgi:hypothetical protein